MAGAVLGQFVRTYLQRVVNERDVTGVEDMVSPQLSGSGRGWPCDIGGLREFYDWQARARPDWHIVVQQTVEVVGEWVAVRAHAGGTVAHDDTGAPLRSPFRLAVEWLAAYRIVDGMITEIQLLSARDRTRRPASP